MPEFVRVYDKATKAVYTTASPQEGVEVLDGPAHDVYGNPLPAEYGVETKTAAKQAAKTDEGAAK